MLLKLYNLGFWCSFAEEPDPAGQAVCPIRQIWKHFSKEEMCSLNGGREMPWRISGAWYYSQVAQVGSKWALGLGRDSAESGGGLKGKRREKQRRYHAYSKIPWGPGKASWIDLQQEKASLGS